MLDFVLVVVVFPGSESRCTGEHGKDRKKENWLEF
jgi:hypothetical protein